MLGNLYLKVTNLEDGRRYYNADGYRDPRDISSLLFGASVLFLWFLLPTWVYLDAKGRGVNSPVRWSILTLVSLVFGLAVYLILRPETRNERGVPKLRQDHRFRKILSFLRHACNQRVLPQVRLPCAQGVDVLP